MNSQDEESCKEKLKLGEWRAWVHTLGWRAEGTSIRIGIFSPESGTGSTNFGVIMKVVLPFMAPRFFLIETVTISWEGLLSIAWARGFEYVRDLPSSIDFAIESEEGDGDSVSHPLNSVESSCFRYFVDRQDEMLAQEHVLLSQIYGQLSPGEGPSSDGGGEGGSAL